MPKRQPQGNAQQALSTGTTIRFGTVTILGGQVFVTPVVFGQGLPTLTSWFLQTAGAAGATVTLQFAHGQAALNTPDFQLLFSALLLLGTVDRRDTRMGAYFYRSTITAGINPVTVRWWLCASS